MKRSRESNPMGLLHGDIVIATKIAHYTHKGAEGIQSQAVGDMLIVNNPHASGFVQGCSLMPGSVGLGNSLAAGTYRLAKPWDKHYVMTLREWDRYQCRRLLRVFTHAHFAVHMAMAIGAAMWLISKVS